MIGGFNTILLLIVANVVVRLNGSQFRWDLLRTLYEILPLSSHG
jgi:hypothetical protein